MKIIATGYQWAVLTENYLDDEEYAHIESQQTKNYIIYLGDLILNQIQHENYDYNKIYIVELNVVDAHVAAIDLRIMYEDFMENDDLEFIAIEPKITN